MNHRRHRLGEFAMRPDRNPTTPNPESPTDRLDQVWAATRPPELSPATMDALWASATRELDRIEAARRAGSATRDRLTLPTRARGRGRRVFMGIALAEAAVVLIGVGFALSRPASTNAPKPLSPIAQTQPAPARARLAARPVIEVAAGQTLHVRIGDDGHHYDFLTEPSISSNLPEGTPHDVFNAMESMASL